MSDPGARERPVDRPADPIGPSLLERADAAALRAVFQLTPTFLSITGLDDGRLLEVNDAFVRITGYTRDEVLGRPMSELNLWVDHSQREQGLAILRRGEPVRGMEARFRMKNGEERVMLLSGDIMNLGGRECVVTVLTDLTDRVRAEEARREIEALGEVRREEAEALAEAALLIARSLDLSVTAGEIVRRLRGLLRSSAALLSLLDVDGRVLTVQAVSGEVGPLWKPGVVVPHDVGLAWRAVRERQVVTSSDLLNDPSVPLSLEVRARVEAARYRAGLGAPLIVNDRVVGALAVGDREGRVWSEEDIRIVEAFAAHAAVAVANARLFHDVTTANRGKDEFLAMLSHELRNPLGTIMNAVEVLDRVAADAMTRRVSGIIGRQTKLLARLVDDLLDVARVTSGKISVERRPIDLRDVAARCLDALVQAGRAAEHLIRLEGGSAPVAGDDSRLEQVVANLLDNALKYTPVGGRITVSTTRAGGHAVLRVSDTGSGIRPEILPRIFDLFTQEPQALDRSRGGLGLGLALVKRLVELHGGTVSAASGGPDEGSEFTVRLPARAPGVEADEPAPPSADAPAARRRVLVVEDNADAREGLRLMLALAGHEVVVADDGPTALEKLAAYRPEVALIDVGLPRLDGYEVAQLARQRDDTRDLYLVALTGYGQAEDRRRALDAGFDHHLIKPVDPAVLRDLMRSGGVRRDDGQ